MRRRRHDEAVIVEHKGHEIIFDPESDTWFINKGGSRLASLIPSLGKAQGWVDRHVKKEFKRVEVFVKPWHGGGRQLARATITGLVGDGQECWITYGDDRQREKSYLSECIPAEGNEEAVNIINEKAAQVKMLNEEIAKSMGALPRVKKEDIDPVDRPLEALKETTEKVYA